MSLSLWLDILGNRRLFFLLRLYKEKIVINMLGMRDDNIAPVIPYLKNHVNKNNREACKILLLITIRE